MAGYTTHYHNLSEEIQKRIINDREKHVQNPYAFRDEDIVRRDPGHDRANLWRPAFVRDTEKIMHVPFYNRYSDKTQVFSLFRNDDISRRALHVQLVSRIARNIGRLLNLNTDLIEAIALGHDIGHTPFGHAGERALSDIYHERTGRYFNHNIHSARLLDDICGLNLSLQTLDGIICHNGEMEMKEYRPVPYRDFETFDNKKEGCYLDRGAIKKLVPATLEGCVVRVCDIIAYLGKDRQDAEKLGLFDEEPEYSQRTIGTTNAEIINNMVVNIVENSYGKDFLFMDEEYFEEFSRAKKENGRLIYGNEKTEKDFKETIEPMFGRMYERLLEDALSLKEDTVFYRHHVRYIKEITKYSKTLKKPYEENTPDDMVTDFIAGMTDDYFIDLYEHLFPDDAGRAAYRGYFDKY
ncbi:MAG: HD domain-containing protein [Lachnospiraceae bacterium]|nr:HD domain-containing protein [Lachnospiraceae bacterium]